MPFIGLEEDINDTKLRHACDKSMAFKIRQSPEFPTRTTQRSWSPEGSGPLVFAKNCKNFFFAIPLVDVFPDKFRYPTELGMLASTYPRGNPATLIWPGRINHATKPASPAAACQPKITTQRSMCLHCRSGQTFLDYPSTLIIPLARCNTSPERTTHPSQGATNQNITS